MINDVLLKPLNQIGVRCIVTKNEIKIFGKEGLKGTNKTINIEKLNDHRICMGALCLSLITGIKSKIKNFETVETSSPSFLKIIKSIGGKYEIKK